MDWSLVLQVAGYVLTVVMFFVAIWLKHDRDMNQVREYVARLIGDALALAAEYATGIAGSVSDAKLDEFSGGIYDYWVPRLPDGLPGLIMALYPKPSFQALFRNVWRQYSDRTPSLEIMVKRQ